VINIPCKKAGDSCGPVSIFWQTVQFCQHARNHGAAPKALLALRAMIVADECLYPVNWVYVVRFIMDLVIDAPEIICTESWAAVFAVKCRAGNHALGQGDDLHPKFLLIVHRVWYTCPCGFPEICAFDTQPLWVFQNNSHVHPWRLSKRGNEFVYKPPAGFRS